MAASHIEITLLSKPILWRNGSCRAETSNGGLKEVGFVLDLAMPELAEMVGNGAPRS
jgi:hypothetical protein